MEKKGKRKRLIAWMLSLCMVLSGVPAPDARRVEAAEDTTVYFYNSGEWGEVYAYTWDGADNTGWPGKPADKADIIGENWYKYTTTAPSFKIIFNNNNGAQTGDISITNENTTYVYYWENKGIHTANSADAVMEALNELSSDSNGTTTVHFYNSSNWDTVYAYAWSEEKSKYYLGGWPGKPAVDEGDGWWKCEVLTGDSFKIIFNAGSSAQQTENITVFADEDEYFTSFGIGGILCASRDAVERTVNNAVTTIYYYNSLGWDKVYAEIKETGYSSCNTNWPGEELKELGDNWYALDVFPNINNFKIVFNDGENKEQADRIYRDELSESYVTCTGWKENNIYNVGFFSTKEAAQNNAGIRELPIHFYTGSDWSGVQVTANNDDYGSVTKPMTKDNDWWTSAVTLKDLRMSKAKLPKIQVASSPDGESVEYTIDSIEKTYFASNGAVFETGEQAMISLGIGATDENSTTVYFKNTEEWEQVYGYVCTDVDESLYGGAPGMKAMRVAEEKKQEKGLEGDWWTIIIPGVATEDAAFRVVFSNGIVSGDEAKTASEVTISNPQAVYAFPSGKLLSDPQQANQFVPVTGITMETKSLKMVVGDRESLTFQLEPQEATDQEAVWNSDNETVASVDAQGNVTATGEGWANIAVTSSDGRFSAFCQVHVNNVSVTGITVSPNTLNMTVGDTETLSAQVTPENATNKEVTWSSGNRKIASVDSKGKVTANGAGTVEITVTSVDGDGKMQASCTIKVAEAKTPISVEDVEVTPEEMSLKVGQTGQLTAKVYPEDAQNQTVTYHSLNPDVAGVNAGGLVTAAGEGTAKIEVISADSGAKAVCTVQVSKLNSSRQSGDGQSGDGNNDTKTDTKVLISGLTVKGASKKIAAGKKLALTANVTPANATDKSVTWTTSNKKYATVSSKGVVTTKKAGAGKSVTITATAKDGSKKKAAYRISIMKSPVKSIRLKASKTTVKAGGRVTIKATVTPSSSKMTNQTLMWKSSNTKYATVSAKGVVKTKKAGKGKKVTITATATDGSKKKATIRIKIK